MPCFPLFIDLTDRPCLIVGGGTIAARKAEKLLPYGAKLTVVAPNILPELAALPVSCLNRVYDADDVTDMALVIAATDDPNLNHTISRDCKARNIPVNVVDDPEACTFLFPSLVQRGDLSVGISTGGASPTAAVWLREQIEELIPNDFAEILDMLSAVRPLVKSLVPEEARRKAVFAALFDTCMRSGACLTLEEFETLVEETK